MNTYIVKLLVQVGEYEKSTVNLINAPSAELAEKEALLCECHCTQEEGGLEWTDNGVYDLFGEFHYSVAGCTLVEPSHVGTLSKYIG